MPPMVNVCFTDSVMSVERQNYDSSLFCGYLRRTYHYGHNCTEEMMKLYVFIGFIYFCCMTIYESLIFNIFLKLCFSGIDEFQPVPGPLLYFPKVLDPPPNKFAIIQELQVNNDNVKVKTTSISRCNAMTISRRTHPHPTPTRTAINPSMREESKSLHDGECVNAGQGTIISYVKLFIKVCVGLLCRFSLDLNSLLEILQFLTDCCKHTNSARY